MGYKIGMDFGTTNSTVAYIDPDTQQPVTFIFPPAEGSGYIPSCVGYHDGDQLAIGRAAFDYAGAPDAIFCNNLKMILPMSQEKQVRFGWPIQKKPETVILDYLRQLLTCMEDTSPSFTRQKGEIDGIVLSVPHVWAKDPSHPGRSALQTIVGEHYLGCKLIQLISEPVAAAAYFAHQHKRQGMGAFSGNLMVCDMGGGTFDVTLCRINPGKIEELYNDGNGRMNLGKAGVQFDTRLLIAKGLTENTYNFFDAYKRLQEFKSNNHTDISRGIFNAIETPDFQAKTIIRAGQHSFNYHDIDNAFQEIRESTLKVLKRVKTGIDTHGYPVNGIFFVGGFSQFTLVRETIKEFWGIGQNDARLIADINNEISRYAIAFGAALVANDKVSVEETFEHTMGVQGVRRVERTRGKYEQEEILIPIITGGKKLGDYDQPVFAVNKEGKDVEVTAYQKDPEVIIFVDPSSQNKPHIQRLPHGLELPHADIPGNKWKIGMRINKSKIVYLIFQDTAKNDRKEYELGDIIRQMFGTLVVEE